MTSDTWIINFSTFVGFSFFIIFFNLVVPKVQMALSGPQELGAWKASSSTVCRAHWSCSLSGLRRLPHCQRLSWLYHLCMEGLFQRQLARSDSPRSFGSRPVPGTPSTSGFSRLSYYPSFTISVPECMGTSRGFAHLRICWYQSQTMEAIVHIWVVSDYVHWNTSGTPGYCTMRSGNPLLFDYLTSD